MGERLKELSINGKSAPNTTHRGLLDEECQEITVVLLECLVALPDIVTTCSFDVP
jgi:hypothetical protein